MHVHVQLLTDPPTAGRLIHLASVYCATIDNASPDIIARLLTQKPTEAWGQQLVVDLRAGAGGAVGAEIVAKAIPDGYTLLLTSPGPSVQNVVLRRGLSEASR